MSRFMLLIPTPILSQTHSQVFLNPQAVLLRLSPMFKRGSRPLQMLIITAHCKILPLPRNGKTSSGNHWRGRKSQTSSGGPRSLCLISIRYLAAQYRFGVFWEATPLNLWTA
jgi:hypothetical protein